MEPALAALGLIPVGLLAAWAWRRRNQTASLPDIRVFEAETGEGKTLLGRQLGPYRLEQLLGKGGWGTVYRGVHHRTGAQVAIKVIHTHLVQDYNDVKRLQREIRTWEQLRHPRLVEFKKYGEELDQELTLKNLGPRRYLVMELVDGQPLRRLMRPEGLPPDKALPLIQGLLEAVTALHANGIIHRDLKPENVMIPRAGGLKLMDFGLAKSAEAIDQLTRQGEVFGTPEYMAPEQLLRQKHGAGEWDARVDQYSLGVIAYELLTGRLPLESASLQRLMHERESMSIRPPKLNPALDAVLLKMLAFAPDDRYPVTRDAADALAQALKGAQ